MTDLRSLLVLGRVSNLSTVWANGLCAWVLGGGGRVETLVGLLAGLSLLYMGGMYLNDFCDIDFDTKHRPERPIPSGKIQRTTVLGISMGLLATGLGIIIWMDMRTWLWVLILLGFIILYNLVHKQTIMGTPLMAACRTGIYPTVGVATVNGMNPSIWAAGILMFYYVLGVSILARTDATKVKTTAVAYAFLILPLIGALYLAGPPFAIYFPVSFCLPALWLAWTFSSARKSGLLVLELTIGPLLAGICLIDLAVLNSMHLVSFTTLGLFLLFFFVALLAQRMVPAS